MKGAGAHDDNNTNRYCRRGGGGKQQVVSGSQPRHIHGQEKMKPAAYMWLGRYVTAYLFSDRKVRIRGFYLFPQTWAPCLVPFSD